MERKRAPSREEEVPRDVTKHTGARTRARTHARTRRERTSTLSRRNEAASCSRVSIVKGNSSSTDSSSLFPPCKADEEIKEVVKAKLTERTAADLVVRAAKSNDRSKHSLC